MRQRTVVAFCSLFVVACLVTAANSLIPASTPTAPIDEPEAVAFPAELAFVADDACLGIDGADADASGGGSAHPDACALSALQAHGRRAAARQRTPPPPPDGAVVLPPAVGAAAARASASAAADAAARPWRREGELAAMAEATSHPQRRAATLANRSSGRSQVAAVAAASIASPGSTSQSGAATLSVAAATVGNELPVPPAALPHSPAGSAAPPMSPGSLSAPPGPQPGSAPGPMLAPLVAAGESRKAAEARPPSDGGRWVRPLLASLAQSASSQSLRIGSFPGGSNGNAMLLAIFAVILVIALGICSAVLAGMSGAKEEERPRGTPMQVARRQRRQHRQQQSCC